MLTTSNFTNGLTDSGKDLDKSAEGFGQYTSNELLDKWIDAGWGDVAQKNIPLDWDKYKNRRHYISELKKEKNARLAIAAGNVVKGYSDDAKVQAIREKMNTPTKKNKNSKMNQHSRAHNVRTLLRRKK